MDIIIKDKDLYLFSKICNLRCEVCTEKINILDSKLINLKDISDIIKKVKINNVYIRGGELFLYQNYKGLLDIIDKYKIFIAINSIIYHKVPLKWYYRKSSQVYYIWRNSIIFLYKNYNGLELLCKIFYFLFITNIAYIISFLFKRHRYDLIFSALKGIKDGIIWCIKKQDLNINKQNFSFFIYMIMKRI